MGNFKKLVYAFKNPAVTLQYLLYKIFATKNTRYTRFIILSHARSGSNLLVSLLNSNPVIETKGEILSRFDDKKRDLIPAFFSRKRPLFIRARGFKLFYYHPLNSDREKAWQLLKATEDLHIIHLKRKNILRTLTSLKIANKTDQWISTHGESDVNQQSKAVSFTIEELNEKFRLIRTWQQESDRFFKDEKLISIYYEDLIDYRTDTLKKIAEFLSVDFFGASTEFIKQNPESLTDLITNYHELKKEFSGTEWSPFFTE